MKLWGREATEAVEADPSNGIEAKEAQPKVEGVEEKMRKAEKALNQAYNQQNKAEQAVNQNKDPAEVYDLMQKVKDAFENTLEKEIALERIREEYKLLDEEFQRANEKRDATFAKMLEKELETAAGELGGLVEAYNVAKGNKEGYDAVETRLREERQAMDTDGSDQAAKDAKDGELSSHQANKDGIYSAYDDAKQAKNDKEGLIQSAANLRE